MRKIVKLVVEKIFKRDVLFDEKLSNWAFLNLVFTLLIKLFRGLVKTGLGLNPRLIFIGKSTKIVNLSEMKLGRNVRVGDYCYLVSQSNNDLIIGSNVSINDFSKLVVSTTINDVGKGIEIGDNVGIGEYSYIGGGGGVFIGCDTIIGQYFSAHPENHIFSSTNVPIRKQGTTRQGISIGSNCWLGAKVTVCDGVRLGSGCVVAAGSVVIHSFPDNTVIAGVPAKAIKKAN
ncbi:DapH/DapD/GlmU-related protein [Photobacterium swingsii]|uniref:DapH/DapD/GlmU-related protein n=1 Tax=Photobacterium swingsii TaxID=680026 RepID=UPI004068871B